MRSAIFFVLMLVGCSSSEQHTEHFHAFGTEVTVQIENVSEKKAQQLFTNIHQQLQTMHRQWHAWQKSELSEIHEACQTGETITVSDDMAYLIREGSKLEQQSLGYFNPAIGELIDLWGFLSHQSTRDRPAPSAEAIAQTMSYHPSMQNIKLEDTQVTCTNSHVRLDFGAYAKGYGVGKIMAYLREQGVEQALINAGGDVMILQAPGSRPKRVGIASPSDRYPEEILTISESTSVFTSGVYARNFQDSQTHKRYHHLINPKTGYPSTTFISVTVIHPDPMVADAAATALLASDLNSWSAIVQSMGIEKYLLITAEGERISNDVKLRKPHAQHAQALDHHPHQWLILFL